MGPPAAAGFGAEDPAVAYNARRNEYLVVWRGDDSPGPLVNDEFEIFAQRLTAAGAEVGANDRRISDMGPNGDTTYSAEHPAVVYNPTSDEYLVAWEGDDNPGPLVEGEDEVFVQRLDARGAPVGANDRRVSDMGPDGDTAFSAENPTVAHNSASNEYLVAWEGRRRHRPTRQQRVRDLRPAPRRQRRRCGGERPARLRDGPRRRRGLQCRGAEPRPQPGERRVSGRLAWHRRRRRQRVRDLRPAPERERHPGRHQRPAHLPDGTGGQRLLRGGDLPPRGGWSARRRIPGGLAGRRHRADRVRGPRPAPRPGRSRDRRGRRARLHDGRGRRPGERRRSARGRLRRAGERVPDRLGWGHHPRAAGERRVRGLRPPLRRRGAGGRRGRGLQGPAAGAPAHPGRSQRHHAHDRPAPDQPAHRPGRHPAGQRRLGLARRRHPGARPLPGHPRARASWRPGS